MLLLRLDYYAAGYCYPYAPSYYPPAYYGAPFFYPTIGLGFGFGGGFRHFDHLHGGGFHAGSHR